MEQIIITHPDGTTLLLNSGARVSGINKAEQNVSLLSEDTVALTITSVKPLNFLIGDKVEVFGRTYKLNLLPTIKKTGARKFTYDLTLEGPQYDLIDVQFLLPADTVGDSLTADLAGFLQLFMTNVLRVFPTKWALGAYPAGTEYKNLTFSGENCLSVLQRFCEEYGQEFEITEAAGVKTLNIRKAGVNFPYTFRYGRTGGLYELTRQNISSKNVVTRLYLYGGSNNLGSDYRYSKLCLPGKDKNASYLENAAAIAAFGIKENTQTFDTIFPSREGSVTALGSKYYAFVDTSINFDLNEKDEAGNTKWLIDGVSAKVKFNSGNLAGYEFDLHSYDHATKTIQLVPFTDENGMKFPSETSAAFQIAVTDKYIFTDINLPDAYKTDAEAALLAKGQEYYLQNCQPQVQYALSIAESFIKQFAGQLSVVNLFAVGDYIPVEDSDLGLAKSIRIISFTRDILKPYNYTITLGDTVTKTTITRVISDLTEIDRIIQINNLADPSKARRNWRASQEVLNMVFDPDGDYYSERIKPLSIETTMLAAGARSQQFVLQNTKFEANYGGNVNVVKVTGGLLVHYTIEDTIKAWQIATATTSGLVSATPYYIYARCSKTDAAGTIVFDTAQRTVNSDGAFYYFLIGNLSSEETDAGGLRPARIPSLTYGSSTVNGRLLNTGRIQSSGSGTTYFDLDTGEIGGNIKFISTAGTTKNVADLDNEASESKDYINNTLPGIISGLQAQIDGQIEQFFYTYDPATTNVPASDWTTTALQEAHLGDLFYNTTTGKVFRWIKNGTVYSWQELQDSEVAQALALANDALALAQTKRRIFVSQPTTPYDAGDLWVQGSTGDIMKCSSSRSTGNYTATDWAKASKYTSDAALTAFIEGDFATKVSDFTTQIDGKIESWFQTTDPAVNWTTDAERAKHVGDMWYNSSINTLKQYNTFGTSSFAWTIIQNATAINAYNVASKAQDTADGKRRVFVAQPHPPYDVGDLWLTGGSTDGQLKRCIAARATGSFIANDFVIAVYYDNTKTTIDGGIVTSGTVQLAGDDASIKAGITGEGTEDKSVRIWAGASKENNATAPYRVLQNGKTIMTDAEVTGTINANIGTIGGFEIGSGRIGGIAKPYDVTPGLSLYDNFIKFADSYKFAVIGLGVLSQNSGLVGVGRFENNSINSFGTNFGIQIKVTGAHYNTAIETVGNIITHEGIIENNTFTTINPDENQCYQLNYVTNFQTILATFNNNNSGIGLPSRSYVDSVFNIDSSTPFKFKVTIICSVDSTQQGYVIGRNSIINNSTGYYMNNEYYPIRLDNNGNEQNGKMNLGKGDIVEFMLIFNGSTYYAYELQHRD